MFKRKTKTVQPKARTTGHVHQLTIPEDIRASAGLSAHNTRTRLLDEAEAADLLNIAPQTLTTWRSTKRYPLPYIRIGRKIRYRESDVAAFIETRTVRATVLAEVN